MDPSTYGNLVDVKGGISNHRAKMGILINSAIHKSQKVETIQMYIT